MDGQDSRRRHAVLVEWLLDRVTVPIAMWGRSTTGGTAIRFLDGARLEWELPAAATANAVDRLALGAELCIDKVTASAGTISVELSGDPVSYEIAVCSVTYDPSTQRPGVRWATWSDPLARSVG